MIFISLINAMTVLQNMALGLGHCDTEFISNYNISDGKYPRAIKIKT